MMFLPWPWGMRVKSATLRVWPAYSTVSLTGESLVLATKAAKQEPAASMMSSLLTA